jgi:hypothetical protein
MRFLALLICLIPCLAFAQDKGGRTCRVVFLGAGEKDPEKLHLHDGTKTIEIDLPRLNLSKVYPLPGGAITLRLLAAPPAEDQPVNPAAPSAAVAEGFGDIYLLVTPDPANQTVPARLQVIDATADRFKPGQMLWYNLTAHEVGGQVGKQKLAMKGRSKLTLDAPADQAGDYNVNLSFRIAGKPALYPLCETRWVHNPANRTVLFILNEPGSRTPRVLGFPDHREDAGKNP